MLQDEADSLADGERGDRDKRKIGIVKLGVTNGIINFVFGVKKKNNFRMSLSSSVLARLS